MQKPIIKNIIFDLGNVICDIAPADTATAFANLGAPEVSRIFRSPGDGQRLLEDIGTGTISFTQFCDRLNAMLAMPLTHRQITDCWNKTILIIQPERIHLLQHLKRKYRTFILSNTNAVHILKCDTDLQRINQIPSLASLVHKAYYSQELGLLKPDPKIYELVIQENNLVPEQTLFIDDLKENIDGAALTGLQTHHLHVGNETIIELLKDF